MPKLPKYYDIMQFYSYLSFVIFVINDIFEMDV